MIYIYVFNHIICMQYEWKGGGYMERSKIVRKQKKMTRNKLARVCIYI